MPTYAQYEKKTIFIHIEFSRLVADLLASLCVQCITLSLEKKCCGGKHVEEIKRKCKTATFKTKGDNTNDHKDPIHNVTWLINVKLDKFQRKTGGQPPPST